MKTGMKTILIICLVLGVALIGLTVYVQANSGHVEEIRQQVASRTGESPRLKWPGCWAKNRWKWAN